MTNTKETIKEYIKQITQPLEITEIDVDILKIDLVLSFRPPWVGNNTEYINIDMVYKNQYMHFKLLPTELITEKTQ